MDLYNHLYKKAGSQGLVLNIVRLLKFFRVPRVQVDK